MDHKTELIKDGETLDDLILGGLQIIQPVKGYRFSLDAILLANFVNLDRVERVFDLGTGNGIIPLLLNFRNSNLKISAIEIQAAMIDRAKRSIQYNKLENSIDIINIDIKEIPQSTPGGIAGLVVSNPPFWRRGEGHISKNLEEAYARHELLSTVHDIIIAARHLLEPGGKLCLINSAARVLEITDSIQNCGMRIRRMRFIYPSINKEAKMVLIEGQKGNHGATIIEPPLIIYQSNGEYCNEIVALYNRER